MQRRPCGGAALSFHESLCKLNVLIRGEKRFAKTASRYICWWKSCRFASCGEFFFPRPQAQLHLPIALPATIHISWGFVEYTLEVVCSLQLCSEYLLESKVPCLNRRITQGLSEYYNPWDLVQFCFLLWFPHAGICSWLMKPQVFGRRH